MKFIRSKFFIVCAIIAVLLVLIPALLSAFGQVDVVRSALKTVAKPFEWGVGQFARATDGFISAFTKYDDLLKENEELRAQINELKQNASDNEALKNENDWLKKYLEIYQSNTRLVLSDARVISYESGNYSTILTLNKGSAHGIKKNMPVITSDGVLGYVSEVGLDWCKAKSIIETSSAVGVYTDRTGVIGTVEGNVELRREGKCLMSYSANADIKVGDRVYTNGSGGIYPSGLLIGTIVSIEADEVTRHLLAVVDPAVNFTNPDELTRVMIVCGYEGGAGQ